ncbi:MAG: adenylyl-sulfate kinase, partial [Candidatus Kapabacteria bacterium]|nr:adenylyl-sulfate kinase [Candidatus Kapabacteria bacterium]
FETYIKCNIEECKNRDPKGLYKKAIEGLIPDFTGISAPYEEPHHPEIVIETEHQTINESARILINKLEDNGII